MMQHIWNLKVLTEVITCFPFNTKESFCGMLCSLSTVTVIPLPIQQIMHHDYCIGFIESDDMFEYRHKLANNGPRKPIIVVISYSLVSQWCTYVPKLWLFYNL